MFSKLKFILPVLVILIISGCYKNAASVEEFVAGDIKDDFCGVDMDFRYCKCAFHNEFCDAIGMSKKEAKAYIEAEYEKWLTEKEEAFANSCKFDGGNYDPGPGTCVFCKPGTSWSEKSGACVVTEKAEKDEEAKEEIDENTKDEEEKKEAEEEEEKKPQSQADCDQGTCFVNGDCLPMLIECKGGAFMKPMAEACALAAKYIDGQPLSTEICYCHGNYCYQDQKCQEIPVKKYCGNENKAKIKNPAGLCALIQKDQDDDIVSLWDDYCDCQTGYCKVKPGQCEEPPSLRMCDEDDGARPKPQDQVCEAMKLEAEKKPVNFFSWCDCLPGYDKDLQRERCVKM